MIGMLKEDMPKNFHCHVSKGLRLEARRTEMIQDVLDVRSSPGDGWRSGAGFGFGEIAFVKKRHV